MQTTTLANPESKNPLRLWRRLGDDNFVVPELLKTKKIPSLDGFRAISILIVVFAHFRLTKNIPHWNYLVLNQLFQSGAAGVRFFFVISGFLITSLLLKEKIDTSVIDLRKFYVRRALRIFPVFYLYLVVSYGINIIFHMGIDPLCFVGPALYLSNLNLFPQSWITGHSWTLSVEEQYYLAWPLLLKKLKGKSLYVALAIVLMSPFLRLFVYYHPAYTNSLLGAVFLHADAIFVGSIFSILLFKGLIPMEKLMRFRLLINVASALIIFVVYNSAHNERLGILTIPFGPVIAAILMGLMILVNAQPSDNWFYRFLNNRIMTFVGKLSYSLYIWQQLFLVPSYATGNVPTWGFFPLNLILAGLTAACSYFLFERYFMKIKDRFKAI